MKDHKKQYIFVAVLLFLVATLSICYAVFFEKEDEKKEEETIVRITGVVANETQGGKSLSMSFDSNSVDVEAELAHAGAYILYDVTIENSKDNKVVLKEILGLDSANSQDPKSVSYEVIGVQPGDIIDAKTKKVVKIKASRVEGEVTTLEVAKKKAKVTFTFE